MSMIGQSASALSPAFVAAPAIRARAPALPSLRGSVPPTAAENSSFGSGLLFAVGSVLGATAISRQQARPANRIKNSGARSVVQLAANSDVHGSTVSYKTVFLFPGQGAQFVGMCKELCETCPEAKYLFDRSSNILGYDLLDRCVNGPKELLNTTAVSQPAIFVASMAAVEKFKQKHGEAAVHQATVAMGLSLGEYSALCFAGAIDFDDGVRITKARGEAMQAAADAADTGMVSVVGLDEKTTEQLCKVASERTGKTVRIANFLCNGNYTVSGDKVACSKVVEIAKSEFKARMAAALPVAGAFHTHFMNAAVKKLEEALRVADVREPRIPVISNVDALPHKDPNEIRNILAKQVTSPVLWEQQVQGMVKSGELEKAFELGPGKVCAGIVKRIDKACAAKITHFEV